MKDYVFFPFALTKPMQKLGKWGNKTFGREIGRHLPSFIGNILVFFIVGIWHGIETHYIIWGLYNGLIISFAEILPPIISEIRMKLGRGPGTADTEGCKGHKAKYVGSVLGTFLIVNIGWYFDRIVDMADCWLCFKNTLFKFRIGSIGEVFNLLFDNVETFSTRALIVILVAIVLVLVYSVMSEKKIDVFDFLQKKNIVIRWGVYYMMMALIQISMSLANSTEAFLYTVF